MRIQTIFALVLPGNFFRGVNPYFTDFQPPRNYFEKSIGPIINLGILPRVLSVLGTLTSGELKHKNCLERLCELNYFGV